MRRRQQQQPSYYTHKNIPTQKVSLKNVRPTVFVNQPTQKSTTCHSIYGTSNANKQSIKNLLLAARSRNHQSQNLISMTYQDIRVVLQQKSHHFLTNLLCGVKQAPEQNGCTCGNKCPWMDHWLSLSLKAGYYGGNIMYGVSRQTEQQIKKDLKRTQPTSKSFQSEQYQCALYQALMAYASLDPQVGYIQGMNIVCSVLLYHDLNVNSCVQVMKFLMRVCGFRQVYLADFQFAYKLSASLSQALKYRCSDLHRHLIDKYEINLSIFIVGWILPMLGNIIPLVHMHMVVNTFIERSWEGLLKIIMTLLLYLRPTILNMHDETELMELLSVQGLKNKAIPWEQIIMSSCNLKTSNFLSL